MQNPFDESLPIDARSALLDIFKVFDKVWHKGFDYKLNLYRISGYLLKLIENCFSHRKQKVVLDSQLSS